MKEKSKVLLVYFFTLTGIFLWVGAIFLAPYLKSQSLSLSAFIYAFFSPICHQIPSRSFFFLGSPLAVCGRCLGIYFGFLAGAAFFPLLKGFSNSSLPKTKTFIFFSLPIVLDTLGNFFHLWITSNWFRFTIGFLWGTLLPFYFIVGIVDFSLKVRKKSIESKLQNGASLNMQYKKD